MVEILVCCHLAFGSVGLAAQDFKFSNRMLMEMPHGGHSLQILFSGQALAVLIAPFDGGELLSVQWHAVVGIGPVTAVKSVVNSYKRFFHLIIPAAPAVASCEGQCLAV